MILLWPLASCDLQFRNEIPRQKVLVNNKNTVLKFVAYQLFVQCYSYNLRENVLLVFVLLLLLVYYNES